MRHKIDNKKSEYILYLCIAVASVIAFCVIYGTKVLNFTWTDWAFYSIDLPQHFLGWKAFRQGEWTFPIGMSNSLSYPIQTSIIFTDSIPLFAVIFKLLSPILPENFQYFGLWGLLCFVLQGTIAGHLLFHLVYTNKESHDSWLKEVGIFFVALLVVLMPCMLYRMFLHTALAGQWIILLALEPVLLYDYYQECKKKIPILFAIIGFLAVAIHIYFLLMCGIIFAGYCIIDILKTKSLKHSLITGICFIVPALFTTWVLGGFSSGMEADSFGLGAYSFNLNALWNPQGSKEFKYRSWSSLLPSYPFGISQYEGFAYLGAGALLLLGICIICWIIRISQRVLKNTTKKNSILFSKYINIGLWFIIIISVIVAASPTVYWGDKLLLKMKLPGVVEKAWAVFRSSGRLVWPVVYILIIVAGASFIRGFDRIQEVVNGNIDKQEGKNTGISENISSYKTSYLPALVTIVLLICFIIQIVDLKDILEYKGWPFKQSVPYSSVMIDSDFWEEVGNDDRIEHIVFMDTNRTISDYYPFGEWALRHHKTISGFYFARSIDAQMKAELSEELTQLDNDSEQVMGDAFIIFDNNMLQCLQHDLYYYPVDDYIVGTTFPLNNYNDIPRESFSLVRSFGENDIDGSIQDDGAYYSNAEDTDVRTIHPGGFSFGPYWDLPAGKYTICIEGENLNNGVLVKLYSENGTYALNYEIIEQSEEFIFVEVNEINDIHGLEIYIENQSDEDVILKDMIVQRR